MSQFSVKERLSWAMRRSTAREEDAAYCLLGIFGVFMPIIYGEGQENAFRRLLREIKSSTFSEDSSLQYSHDRFELETFLSDLNLSSSTKTLRTHSKATLETDSDDDSDVASIIFSDGEMSNSSASSAGMNPAQTSGIREVSRALLGQGVLEALYTTAVHNLEREKARTHIRGFLKEYGRNLLVEAGRSNLQIQAAKFVRKLAGRIADEISYSVTAFDDTNPPVDTKIAKKDLEGWLSSLQPQSAIAVPAANIESMFEGVDSDDELDNSLQFPNIELVRDFLVHSEAFRTLVKAMRSWLKVSNDHTRDAQMPKFEMPGNLGKITDPDRISTSNLDVSNFHELGGSAGDLAGSKIAHDTVQGTDEDPQADEATSKPIPKGTKSTEQSTVAGILHPHSQQNVPQEAGTRPIALQNYSNVSDLVSGLLEYWGISFFFYDLVEVFVPPVPLGYERFRWRCVSCDFSAQPKFSRSR